MGVIFQHGACEYLINVESKVVVICKARQLHSEVSIQVLKTTNHDRQPINLNIKHKAKYVDIYK